MRDTKGVPCLSGVLFVFACTRTLTNEKKHYLHSRARLLQIHWSTHSYPFSLSVPPQDFLFLFLFLFLTRVFRASCTKRRPQTSCGRNWQCATGARRHWSWESKGMQTVWDKKRKQKINHKPWLGVSARVCMCLSACGCARICVRVLMTEIDNVRQERAAIEVENQSVCRCALKWG